MHAVYKTTNTWTMAQAVADISMLCSGTTDINSLSASCDKTQTSIVANTVPADWTLYDATPTTISGQSIYNMQVLSRQGSRDNLTKYLGVYQYSTNSYLGLIPMTSWNNTTHTGTDVYGGYTTRTLTNTVPTTFYIWVTPSYIIIHPYQSSAFSGTIMSLELNRSELVNYSNWWAESNGKSIGITAICSSSYSTFSTHIPVIKNPTTTGNTVGAITGTIYRSIDTATYPQRNINETTNGVIMASHYVTVADMYLGTINDLTYIVNYNAATMNTLDEFTYNGKTYQIIKSTYNNPTIVNSFTYWAVPKE